MVNILQVRPDQRVKCEFITTSAAEHLMHQRIVRLKSLVIHVVDQLLLGIGGNLQNLQLPLFVRHILVGHQMPKLLADL